MSTSSNSNSSNNTINNSCLPILISAFQKLLNNKLLTSQQFNRLKTLTFRRDRDILALYDTINNEQELLAKILSKLNSLAVDSDDEQVFDEMKQSSDHVNKPAVSNSLVETSKSSSESQADSLLKAKRERERKKGRNQAC
jgi:hypothetical protein